jgi:hypothetical protein
VVVASRIGTLIHAAGQHVHGDCEEESYTKHKCMAKVKYMQWFQMVPCADRSENNDCFCCMCSLLGTQMHGTRLPQYKLTVTVAHTVRHALTIM